MEEIHSLIKCLTSAEWQSLQQYIACFSTHDTDKNKSLQLATILREAENVPTENFCSLKVYGKKPDISFDALKCRVKGKVLDFLLTDVSTDKLQELDEVDLAYIRIKKLSAQYQQLFYSKPRLKLTSRMLDEIIELSKRYEYFSATVEHLKLKSNEKSLKASEEEFEAISKEIEEYSEKSKILVKAEYYYHRLIAMYEFAAKPDKQKVLAHLKKALPELEEDYKLTKAPRIKYYWYFLRLDYFLVLENYAKARSICLDLLTIVRNNKSVKRRQRVSVVFDNLSRCEYYLGHYEQAAECAREAQSNFNQHSENYCIALEQEFYALFAQEKYADAVTIANKMLNSATEKELGEFRHSKYYYLLANALFKQRKFHDVLDILSRRTEISKDKTGWEIGARLLKIMTQLEMLNLDEASLTVLSLRRYIQNNDKKTPISARDNTILKLLRYAESKGFMFSTLNGRSEKYLTELNSNDEKLRWEPFTHELIPIHKWMADKMKIKLMPEKLPEVKEKKALVRVGK